MNLKAKIVKTPLLMPLYMGEEVIVEGLASTTTGAIKVSGELASHVIIDPGWVVYLNPPIRPLLKLSLLTIIHKINKQEIK